MYEQIKLTERLNEYKPFKRKYKIRFKEMSLYINQYINHRKLYFFNKYQMIPADF